MNGHFAVYLVGMHDGVARACRVAWSFGCQRVVLVDSTPPRMRYLFSAKGLRIETADALPDDVLVLEVRGKTEISQVKWAAIPGVAIGGPSVTLPTRRPSARIVARPPCLVGDQALAVALYLRGAGEYDEG